MRIALIGYGAMGRLIDSLAAVKGHQVVTTVNRAHDGLDASHLAEALSAAEVAIDFTSAKAVRRNVEACVFAGVPIVQGTTGWDDERGEIARIVTDGGGAMVFGANFSIGMNLFFKIAEYSAKLFAKIPEYEVFLEEQHHSRKKDAPSGTALKIKDLLQRHVAVPSVAVTRAGHIPGTHRVGFDSAADQVLLEHTARSREGFAIGAIMAAEWIIGRKGVFEFTDVIDEMIKG